MSGHNRWSKIGPKKAVSDAKKGKVYSRLAKELTLAAKAGGNPHTNAALRNIIQRAKAVSMTNDKIDHAIKKGTGELPSETLEEVTYEAFIHGIGIVIKALTDNKNRAAAEIRKVLNSHHATMATQGSVSRLFSRKGVLCIPMPETTPELQEAAAEALMGVAIEAGANEFDLIDDHYEAVTEPSQANYLSEALAKAGYAVTSVETPLVPHSYVPLDKTQAKAILGLLEALEDLDDVQEVHSNMTINEDVAKQLENEP